MMRTAQPTPQLQEVAGIRKIFGTAVCYQNAIRLEWWVGEA